MLGHHIPVIARNRLTEILSTDPKSDLSSPFSKAINPAVMQGLTRQMKLKL
jgi:hypothetical protein